MKLLLDSHIAYWAVYETERLPNFASLEIVDPVNELFLSLASLWELGNKAGIGRLPLAGTSVRTMVDRLLALDVKTLPITESDIVAAASLPPYHLDPFDRMLIAQARANGLTLVTVDADIPKYDVAILGR